jgi:hypothetical protein
LKTERASACPDTLPQETFWDFPPTPPGFDDLPNCCAEVKNNTLYTSDCEPPTGTANPKQWRWHCLWGLLEECMGLREKNSDWVPPGY